MLHLLRIPCSELTYLSLNSGTSIANKISRGHEVSFRWASCNAIQ